MSKRSIQSTVYPYGYDKNGNYSRGKKFTKNFNEWAAEIKEANMSSEAIMEVRLLEAKKLIGITN